MPIFGAVGYVASGLVLVAFGMKDMIRLRIVAILSNIAFFTYGMALGLTPVWVLHALLLPLNMWRLSQALAGKREGADRIGNGRWASRYPKCRPSRARPQHAGPAQVS